MDKLQDFINERRELLDSEVPAEGHLDRFKARLSSANQVRKPNVWLVASAAAVAGLIITFTFSLLLNTNGIFNQAESELASVKISPEIVRIDQYYQAQVTQKQQLITQMMTGDRSALYHEVTLAMQDMNDNYQSIINDIAISPMPYKAAFVLTRFYQAQLDALDGIILRMQDVYMFNK